MHITFNRHLPFCLNEIFKNPFASSLTPLKQKILLVVGAVLILVAAICVIKSICFKAQPSNKKLPISNKDLLDKISSKLCKQQDDLFNGPLLPGQTRKSSETIVIDNLGIIPISIVVNMETGKNSGPPPGAVVCGGGSTWRTAKVVISPENDQVVQAVATHFKSKTLPAMMMTPPMPLFTEVEINGKNLKM